MPYKSQEYKRSDVFLDNCLVIKIKGQTRFVDEQYNILDNLNDYVGCDQMYKLSFLNNYDGNFLQIHDMGHIPYLENLNLSSIDINELNKNSLTIFITEQVIHTDSDYCRLVLGKTDTAKHVSNSISYNTTKTIWSPELDSIETFVKKNKLTNVSVCVSFDDTTNVYKDRYSFRLYRNDACLDALKNLYNSFEGPAHIRPIDIDKKFWCGNWRYSSHRHLITAYASTLDTEYSWGFIDNDLKVLENTWFDLEKFKFKDKLVSRLNYLNQNNRSIDIPITSMDIDSNILDDSKRPQEIPAGPYDTNQYANSELFKNTFCSIVNLSTFAEPFPCYDEKALNAIFNVRPFILCGPPGSLELMRNDGFKTFGDFWDESYDNELDHTKRLEKIFELINKIDSWSIRECQDIYTEMIPILFENYHAIKDPNI
jgi:hypothetical protein